MSQRARSARARCSCWPSSVVLAGALLAGLLLPWVGGPALVAAAVDQPARRRRRSS